MEITNPDIETYAEKYTTGESKLLTELVDNTVAELEYSEMLSGPIVGRLLKILVSVTGSKRILEIGTFTGYSALQMAEALPENGILITCEVNERYEKMARSFFKRSKHGHKIDLRMGPAFETLQKLEDTFDLVFIDADKINYPRYYELVHPKVKTGGLILIDNAFWNGAVLRPDDDQSRAIHQLNRMISDDPLVEQVILPIRDGLTLVRKHTGGT